MATKNAITIYHNPRCGKSRSTLAILEAKGIEPRIVEYLKIGRSGSLPCCNAHLTSGLCRLITAQGVVQFSSGQFAFQSIGELSFTTAVRI